MERDFLLIAGVFRVESLEDEPKSSEELLLLRSFSFFLFGSLLVDFSSAPELFSFIALTVIGFIGYSEAALERRSIFSAD